MNAPLTGPVIAGIDGSTFSLQAAMFAAGIARDLKLPLELVWVRQPVMLPPIDMYAETIEKLEVGEQQLAEQSLEKAAHSAPELASAKRVVLIGGIVEQLITYANARNAGMVVVGSRGQGSLARVAFGSVADGLVHSAHVPVLVFHPV